MAFILIGTLLGNSMKKCRARYGLDQQNQWCKPCRYDTQLQDPFKHTHTHIHKKISLFGFSFII